MNATGYIINSILVLLVLRQIRETRLDLANLVLPVLLVGAAAAYYLHSVPTAGHDVLLDVTLGSVGLALGALCALATRLRRGPGGVALAKAGIVAAVLWVAGLGADGVRAVVRPRRRAAHRQLLHRPPDHRRRRLGGRAGRCPHWSLWRWPRCWPGSASCAFGPGCCPVPDPQGPAPPGAG